VDARTRVVQIIDFRTERILPGDDCPQGPELLHIPDMREVPHERRHERRVLVAQLAVAEDAGQRQAPGASGRQPFGDVLPELLVGPVLGVHAGHSSLPPAPPGGPVLKQVEAT
jgi:hypothetical protein